MDTRLALRLAATAGFLAVALGAFGAHGLKNLLITNGTEATWQTAASYHLAHALALLILAYQAPVPRLPFLLLLTGLVIFSGSLYVLAVTNIKILGAITPIDGLLLLAGWATLAFRR